MPPIPKLVLDPANDAERYQQAMLRTVNASGGLISGESDPTLEGILEGMVYADAELAYLLNRMPEALALEVLRLYGIERSAGTKARGAVTVTLRQPSTGFGLPVGYLVPYQPTGAATGSGYKLTETLYIPPGELSGIVSVEATAVGEAYNLGAYRLQVPEIGQSLVAMVTNHVALDGGSGLETLEALQDRGNQEMRRRLSIVSATDYATAAEALYSGSCRAIVVPFLSKDKTDENALGQVHVFLVGADGQLPSASLCAAIQADMQRLVLAGSKVWVSSAVMQPLQVSVTCRAEDTTAAAGQQVAAAVRSFLSPLTFDRNVVDIYDLAAAVLDVPVVQGVSDLRLENRNASVQLQTLWTLPQVDGLEVTLVNAKGQSVTHQLGTGIGDPD